MRADGRPGRVPRRPAPCYRWPVSRAHVAHVACARRGLLVCSVLTVALVGCGKSGAPNTPGAAVDKPEKKAEAPAAELADTSDAPEGAGDTEGTPTAAAADAADAPPPAATLEAPDGTVMKPCPEADALPKGMACIPGGPFMRGSDDGAESERPQAEIWISTFLMDVNEVTYREYEACEKAGRCEKGGPQYVDFDRPLQPVNGVTWFQARQFCEAHGKRLPTEAEWEKAARGTDGRLYPWGDEVATCERAIIKGETEGRGCGLKKTKGKKPETGRPWLVGSRPPNQFGLYDMAGNSWEWVQDWYASSYGECGEACTGTDPRGPCDGADECDGYRRRGLRGGSWYWPAERATTVHRRAHVPRNEPFHHFGFRCAADLAALDEIEVPEGIPAEAGRANEAEHREAAEALGRSPEE